MNIIEVDLLKCLATVKWDVDKKSKLTNIKNRWSEAPKMAAELSNLTIISALFPLEMNSWTNILKVKNYPKFVHEN